MDSDSSLFSFSSSDDTGRADRREFLKRLAVLATSSALIAQLPWWSPLRAAPVGDTPADRVRLGLIGVGTRGNLHIAHLLRTPGVDIAALCDDYEPHLQAGMARVHGRQRLRRLSADAGYARPGWRTDCDASLSARADVPRCVFRGQARLLREESRLHYRGVPGCRRCLPRQQKGISDRSSAHVQPCLFARARAGAIGQIGQIKQIRAYWHRNGNWRNPVPDSSLERRLNWRLYRAYSCGLMTELASHHMQVANWFLGTHPVSCVGYGSINYWKDGRELYDNVNVMYRYANGTHVIYDSLISNVFYGSEIQIMGPKGTIEAESGPDLRGASRSRARHCAADQRIGTWVLRYCTHRWAELGARSEERHQGQSAGQRQDHRRRNCHFTHRLCQRGPVGAAHSGHDGTGVQSRSMRLDGAGRDGTAEGDRLAGRI